jgi:hypothetical protein
LLIDTYTGGAVVGETVDNDTVVNVVGVGEINVVILAMADVEPLAVENNELPISTRTIFC